MYIKQRAKIDWVMFGEETSPIFHRGINARKARSTICNFRDCHGIELTSKSEVENEVVNYFTRVLGSSTQGTAVQFDLQGNVLDYAFHEALCCLPSDDEIKVVFHGIATIKSSGPNVFGSLFFKSQWDVIDRKSVV